MKNLLVPSALAILLLSTNAFAGQAMSGHVEDRIILAASGCSDVHESCSESCESLEEQCSGGQSRIQEQACQAKVRRCRARCEKYLRSCLN